jgi:hypothetical protein
MPYAYPAQAVEDIEGVLGHRQLIGQVSKDGKS